MGSRCSVVLIDRQRLLMVRQTYKGRDIWTFPGGSREPGETPAQAAVREAFEETGLVVSISRLLLECYLDKIGGTYACFLGTVSGGEMKLGSDPELDGSEQELKELRWIHVSELPDNSEVRRLLPLLEGEFSRFREL